MYFLNLKKICCGRGITMSELSRKSGIPQPSLSRYAAGKSDITLKQLSRIATALGVGLEKIVETDILTEQYEARIKRTERDEQQKDKAWVTAVLCDLQRHYYKKWHRIPIQK